MCSTNDKLLYNSTDSDDNPSVFLSRHLHVLKRLLSMNDIPEEILHYMLLYVATSSLAKMHHRMKKNSSQVFLKILTTVSIEDLNRRSPLSPTSKPNRDAPFLFYLS